MKTTSTFLVLFLLKASVFAQAGLPVLKANSPDLSILDGQTFKKDHWTVSPEIPLDVYAADKAKGSKSVVYYSDLDSISFVVERGSSFDFWVVLNEKDSCLQRLKSGLPSLPDENAPLESDTILFVLTPGNNISIPVLVNGMDSLNLMFHSAASGVGLTNDAVSRMESAKEGRLLEGASAWGGEGEMRVSTGNRFQVGRFSWEDMTMFQSEHSGRGTDGKFGVDLFANKVLELDYEKKIFVVHSRLPKLERGFVEYKLLFQNHMMFLEGALDLGEDEELELQMLIHSGYSGTLLLDDVFVSKHKVGEKLAVISEGELKDSFGNVLKTKKATLPKLAVGGTEFLEMPVGFFEGSIGRQKMSVMGGDLLRRFDVVLDFQNAVIYLRPNGLAGIAYTELK